MSSTASDTPAPAKESMLFKTELFSVIAQEVGTASPRDDVFAENAHMHFISFDSPSEIEQYLELPEDTMADILKKVQNLEQFEGKIKPLTAGAIEGLYMDNYLDTIFEAWMR